MDGRSEQWLRSTVDPFPVKSLHSATHFHCPVPHVAFKFPFVDPFEPPNPLSAQVQDLLVCQLERTLLNESEVEFGGDPI